MGTYETSADLASAAVAVAQGKDDQELEASIDAALATIAGLGNGVVGMYLAGSGNKAKRRRDGTYTVSILHSTTVGLDPSILKAYCYNARSGNAAARARAVAAGDDYVVDDQADGSASDDEKFMGVLLATSSFVSGTYRASASIDSRAGFGTDTTLPEFGGTAAPEQEDDVVTSFTISESGGVISGTYVDETWVSCAITGTFTPATGAVTFSGACDDFDVSFSGTLTVDQLSGTVTVERGAAGGASSSEDRLFPATQRGGSLVSLGTAYYVDSINGDDGNAGTSPGAPKATIAGVYAAMGSAWVDDVTIRLARGSRWREQMGEDTWDSPTVQSYGVGPRPILDAADVVAAGDWSAAGGTANVYENDFTPEVDVSGRFIVLQDGVALQYVADEATCDSTEGSYTAPLVSGAAPYTVQVHRRGGGAPVGNEMEVSSRGFGIVCEGSPTIQGLHTRCGDDDSGSLVVYMGDATDDATLDDCVAEWGGKHNLYVAGGTVSRCVGLYWMPADTTSTTLVFYRGTANGVNCTFDDCAAINHPRIYDKVQDGAGPFIAHMGDTPNKAGDVVLRHFGVAYANGGLSHADLTSFTLEDSIFERSASTGAGSAHVRVTDEFTIRRCRFYGHTGAHGQRMVQVYYDESSGEIEDSVFVGADVSDGLLNLSSTGATVTVDVNHCVFAAANLDGTVYAIGDTDAAELTNENNMFITVPGGMSRAFTLDKAGSTLVASDYNVYYDNDSGDTIQVRDSQATAVRDVSVFIGEGTYDQNSSLTSPTWNADTITGPRPHFQETDASAAARGFAAGPRWSSMSDVSGTTWALPTVYAAWLPYVESLAMGTFALDMDPRDASSITMGGSGVESMDSQVGGITYSAPAEANQPGYDTDELALVYDGANHYLNTVGVVITASADHSFYLVHAADVDAGTGMYLFNTSNESLNIAHLTFVANNTGINDGAWHQFGAPTTGKQLLSFVGEDGVDAQAYRDQAALGANWVYDGGQIGGNTGFGANNNGSYKYDGLLYRLLIRGTADDDETRETVERILQHQHALAA